MIKKISVALFIGAIAVLFINPFDVAYTNVGGSVGGYSGSGADGGNTCSSPGGCHVTFGATSMPGWITSDIPAQGYQAGDTFSINVKVVNPGVTKFGFELAAEDGSDNKVGEWIITSPTTTKTVTVGGGKNVTQNSTFGTDSLDWDIDWVAPAVGTGQVTFYAAMNATNNNAGNSGDTVYTSTLAVDEGPDVTGIDEVEKLHLKAFPNPVVNAISVVHPFAGEQVTIDLIDLNGRHAQSLFVGTGNVNGHELNLDVSPELSNGLYSLVINSEGRTVSDKILINR